MTDRERPDLVCYGGKGGVGKTTCAAGHALALAARGEETLVVSTDPAHSLGDAVDVALGAEPTAVAPGLDAVEVAAETGQDAYRGVIEALAASFREAGLRLDEADLDGLFEAGLIPGGDEVAALECLARYADADYDHVVLDTAPTGHTLRLLDLPDVLAETLGVAGDVRRRVDRTARAARSVVFGPVAYWGGDRADADAVAALRDRVEAVGDLLRDSGRTRFRVVLIPERLAVAETERLVARLRAVAVPVDALVVNRLFTNPSGCDCRRCRRDAERHADRLATVESSFDLPVRRLPERETEPRGREALLAVGERLVGE